MSIQQSKPFSLKVSAPGKVILFGEYSVVFNKPAIAATLCLYTKLHLTETNLEVIHIKFSALHIDKKFSIEDVKKQFNNLSSNSWETYLQLLKNTFKNLYEQTYGVFDLTDSQTLSMITFFHCFQNVFKLCNGLDIKVESELPVGSGVGSSASYSVVLSTAVLLFEKYKKNCDEICDLIERRENGTTAATEIFRNQISEIAFSCEKLFHGNPSGVDHNTILQGFMLEFVKSDYQNKLKLIDTLPIKIILVDTNVPRSTKKLVESFFLLKSNHPEVINNVLNAMENVVKNATVDLTSFKENSSNLLERETHLSELVTLNHNLLRVLGVSHPSLEKIVSTANKYNLSAKLTGAGGGGFGFIYLPSKIDSVLVEKICKELSDFGFTPYEVTLGGAGLTIDELIY